MNEPAMESDIHDDCSGNRWNSCENFNAPSLDFQGYMSISREHPLAPSMDKDSALAYNPFLALNYPQDLTCLPSHHNLYHQHPVNGRGLWQCQGQQSLKRKSNIAYSPSRPLSRKSFNSKHLHSTVGDISSTAGNLSLQPNDASFPPVEMPLQNTQAFLPLVEQPLARCNETNQNMQSPSNLCNSKCRTTQFRNNSSVASTRKRRKNPLPKKRMKCHNKDFQVKNKRCRNEDSWLRNRRKKARAKGESYVSVLGKTVPARSVKPMDCSKCKFNCQSLVSEEDRQKLFDSYWGLETFKEKVDFICTWVQEFVPLRPKSGKRAFSRRYKFHVNGKEERVCKEFFTSTLDVHESTIGTYLNKKRQDSDTIQDLRGKRAPSNKTPDNVLRKIREHILSHVGLQSSFDKAPSEEAKSVKQLYGLYKVECNEENVKSAGVAVYRKVFTDLHKGENARPITLPPVKDFNRCVKSFQNPSACSSKDTGTKETPISLSSVSSSHVGQIVSAHSESHQDSVKIPTSNNNGILSQQNEISVALTSIDFINENIVKRTLASHISNLPVFPVQDNNHCVQSQDIMEHGSLGLPVLQHQPVQSHQSMQLSGIGSNKDGNDCSHSEKDRSAAEIPSCSSKTFIRNNFTHCTQSSSSKQGDYQPLQISCSEGNPQFILPKHIIPSLQDSDDDIALEPPKTAVCKSTDRWKDNNSKANERGSRDMMVNIQKSKTGSDMKKRQRNEELWARNVRKRLRFKGEEYTSVTGKKVQARKVQVVDCSKCKFQCPTKVSEKQREQINSFYWNLDSYERKVAFIAKHVQTYQPKRKMTGRRAFSRNYTFEVDGKEVRVCKDFFQATLDIGQSTVATSLEKTRKGPEAVKELRGKRSPVNKTPDTIIQDICELVVYVTGLRPHRNHEKNCFGHNVKSLYQAYVYDAELKGKKVASMGVFRTVLQKQFGLSGISNLTKIKKLKESSFLYQHS